MTPTPVLRGVRGAITVDDDSAEAIRTATAEMVGALLERNGLAADALVSMLFTMTPDLRAEFPAVAAREMGLSTVPLLCATEIAVPGSLTRCIRVLVHCYMPPADAVRHVYLRDARRLRSDLAE